MYMTTFFNIFKSLTYQQRHKALKWRPRKMTSSLTLTLRLFLRRRKNIFFSSAKNISNVFLKFNFFDKLENWCHLDLYLVTNNHACSGIPDNFQLHSHWVHYFPKQNHPLVTKSSSSTTGPLCRSQFPLPSNLWVRSEPPAAGAPWSWNPSGRLLVFQQDGRNYWDHRTRSPHECSLLLSRSRGSPYSQNEHHSSLGHRYQKLSAIHYLRKWLHNLKANLNIFSITIFVHSLSKYSYQQRQKTSTSRKRASSLTW